MLQLVVYLYKYQLYFQVLKDKVFLLKPLKKFPHYRLNHGQLTGNLLTLVKIFNLISARHRLSILRYK